MDYHKTIKKRNNYNNYKVSSFTPILKKTTSAAATWRGLKVIDHLI